MVTFILLFFFLALAIVLGVVAYSANNRKRAGQSEFSNRPAKQGPPSRATGSN